MSGGPYKDLIDDGLGRVIDRGGGLYDVFIERHLTLTQTNLTRKYVGSIAGWHVFLETLPGAVEGVRTPWREGREVEIRELYRPRLPSWED